ncbi:MAG: hypothetical protein AB2705_09650 [Candidatus Thiodiazotropha sp.]
MSALAFDYRRQARRKAVSNEATGRGGGRFFTPGLWVKELSV